MKPITKEHIELLRKLRAGAVEQCMGQEYKTHESEGVPPLIVAHEHEIEVYLCADCGVLFWRFES